MSKNIIVITGGAGFVGTNLIKLFLKKTKYKIISIDDYSSGNKNNHLKNKRVKYIRGNTKNISSIIKNKKKIKTVFHFGEFARIYQSFLKMNKCIESNSVGSNAVFNFCLKYNIKLIYSATSASLGNNGNDKNLKDKTSITSLLKSLPKEWNGYDAIIGEPTILNRPKWIKLFKDGKLAMLRNFKEVFKDKFSIRFQFDMYHGNGILDKAINLLPEKDKYDFSVYVSKNTEFNQGNMFVSKSSEIINLYFSEIFDWLKKCEAIFGFNLKGYNKIRMYTFLAERFLPYWFKKYTNALEWPVVYCDIKNNEEKKI